MARAGRRSVGSDPSSPTASSEQNKYSSSASVDPLRSSEKIYTANTIPKFDRNGNISSKTNSTNYNENVNINKTETQQPKRINFSTPKPEIDEVARARDRMEFYAKYDVMTGIRIAATLGGFFIFMVFLVVYKSRSKSSKALKEMQKDPKMAAVAAAVMQEEEDRELQVTMELMFPDEMPYLNFKRQRMLSVGNISAPPVLNRGFRFSSVSNGYSSLVEPTRPRRYSYSGTRRKSTSSSRILSAYPMGDSFGTDDFFAESEGEEEDDFDQGTVTADVGTASNYLSIPIKGQDSRRSSDITCCSTESSYLERRCSAVTLGLTPMPPISSRDPSRHPSQTDIWEYYPEIQIIQPTPKSSPCPSEGNIFERTALTRNGGRNIRKESEVYDYIAEYPEPHHPKLDDSFVETTCSSRNTRRAPLASLSSFKISSADYQDSDLKSLGSDSVFAESYADTDEDMEQFSTDSDEISDVQSPRSVKRKIIRRNSGSSGGYKKRLILNEIKQNSVSLNTFETKAIIERESQYNFNKQIRPASFSGCINNYSRDNSSKSKCNIDVANASSQSSCEFVAGVENSPSVILELPVISSFDEPKSDPSIPGPSRKWSRETLF